jgi:magnesium transporter
MDTGISITQLKGMTEEEREDYFSHMKKITAQEFKALLDYPENSVGRQMSPEFSACSRHLTVDEAMDLLRRQDTGNIKHLFLLDDSMQLDSILDIHQLVLANGDEKLSNLSRPVVTFVNAMEEVIEKLDKFKVAVMPVVDVNHKLVGIIRSQGLLEALRDDIATNMATMVGASRDEKAVSSSFFAVKKRQPWLQINLLTAFAASAVVGLFEDTIAQFTALAVLLPIAAGQSGNTGAQSLAVTMRGLTVREITMRHWFRVMIKELGAGFINVIGIAVTCSAGVFLWSRSAGLALVMALAMIISMTIAGTAGAVIPILLKRFGLDPAQSSSIVLTTVTDIAGFMSFLGIATLLSSMLVAG